MKKITLSLIFVLLVSLLPTRGIADNNPESQDQNERYYQMFRSFFEKHASLSPDLTNIFPFGTPHFLDDLEQKHSITIKNITYKNRDLVVLEVLFMDWEGGAWVNSAKNIMTYDANEYVIEMLLLAWEEGVWINAMKYFMTNNNYGWPLVTLGKAWDPEQLTWVDMIRMTTSYDQGIYPLETLMEFYFQGAWMNMMNMFYTWSNDLLMEILTLSWDFMALQWEYDTKEIFTYDANDLNIEKLNLDWDGMAWVNETIKYLFYDGQGHNIENWTDSWENGVWVDYLHFLFYYDGSWNNIEEVSEIWYNSMWTNHQRFLFTYDVNNNLIEELSMDWQSRGWEYVSKALFFYGTVGIDDDHGFEVNSINAEIIPNPFYFSTNIQLILNQDAYVTIGIYDLTGRCVKSLINEFMLSGEHLVTWDATDDGHVRINSGIYFCRIQVDQALRTYKVVVR